MATVAPAVLRAFQDANARWPNRKKAGDGTLPSAAHMAQSPNSDHNTGEAFDITHDPDSGCDGEIGAAFAVEDPRTKYVIWNRKIWSRQREAEGWRPYDGANPHTHHWHVSILPGARNDVRPWPWSPEHVKQEQGNIEMRGIAGDGAKIAFGTGIALGAYGLVRWLFGLMLLSGCAVLEQAKGAIELGRDIAVDAQPCQQAQIDDMRAACDSQPNAAWCKRGVDREEKRLERLYNDFNAAWCALPFVSKEGCEKEEP